MAEEIYIYCGTGPDAYKVTMLGKGFDDMDLSSLKDKSGEDLVTAIRSAPAVTIEAIMRRNANGKLNDGPNGEPAVMEFKNGMMWELRYQDGRSCEGVNGEPSFQKFAHDGKLLQRGLPKPPTI